MRWFFLPFLVLLAIVGNLILFDDLSTIKVLGIVVFNILVSSLCSFWWCSYFKVGQAKARGLILSHALFMLSLGLGFFLVGAEVTISDNCDILVSNRESSSFSLLAKYAQSFGLCREMGVLVVLLGSFLVYPSILLFSTLIARNNHNFG